MASKPNQNVKLIVDDKTIDRGNDLMLKSIADLESRMSKEMASLRSDMAKEFASLRTELGKDIASLRSDMNTRFKAIDKHFKLIEWVMPIASAFFMIAVLAVIALGVM